MTKLKDEILEFNRKFVAGREYRQYDTSKYPDKKLAVLSCMDTRLTELLPAAMNFRNGDVKIIKNAGATVSHPFGSVMRSLLIAIYELQVEEIAVVGHQDCGMQNLQAGRMLARMRERGIRPEQLELIGYCGINLENWLTGFGDARKTVQATVSMIAKHPLVAADVSVYGFLMDPATGELAPV